jgi:hypothetical protein
MIVDLLLFSLAAYAITFLITTSFIFQGLREWIKLRLPYLRSGDRHFIECRACVSFWVVLFLFLVWHLGFWWFIFVFSVYGLTYLFSIYEAKSFGFLSVKKFDTTHKRGRPRKKQ